MSNGFGISEEDVYTILLAKEVQGASWELAEAVLEELDLSRVERAALNASDDLDEQTMAAAEEIWLQAQQAWALAPHFAAQRASEMDAQLPPARPTKSTGPRF